jgi:RING finger and CHY zinc finger domain-containing protein 1
MSSAAQGQGDLRERLSAIRGDSSLSAQEKSRLCQEAMAQHHSHRTQHHSSVANDTATSCSHYQKKCSNFLFSCCNLIDPCHRCHSERGTCQISPPQIQEIMCNECETKQPPSASCVNCKVQFSNSYCPKCQIWTVKNIHHCDKCRLCRVGLESEMFHCDNCDCCFTSSIAHECQLKHPRDACCMVCQELLYSSQRGWISLPCQHFIHCHCANGLLQNGQYRCPTCRKSMVDMKNYWEELRLNIRSQPLPDSIFNFAIGSTVDSPMGKFKIETISIAPQRTGERDAQTSATPSDPDRQMFTGMLIGWELANHQNAKATFSRAALARYARVLNIWCNDCAVVSRGPFHFLGLECSICHGFNTVQDSN